MVVPYLQGQIVRGVPGTESQGAVVKSHPEGTPTTGLHRGEPSRSGDDVPFLHRAKSASIAQCCTRFSVK